MAMAYDLDIQLKELAEISSEYLDWFALLNQAVFYPDHPHESITTPQSFDRWIGESKGRGGVDEHSLDTLVRRHAELLTAATQILQHTQNTGKHPDFEVFDAFAQSFKNFMDKIRNIEKDIVLGSSGLDSLTGLRLPAVMQSDLEKEMQRLSRQGRPFSVALLKIDAFDALVEKNGKEKGEASIKAIAGLIKRSVRPFDDAYYIGDAQFVLSLKQADAAGGVKALERLKELQEQEGMRDIPLSCCVAEPVEGDRFEDLIENLKKDLKHAQKSGDSVLQYFEMSPLERFVTQQS